MVLIIPKKTPYVAILFGLGMLIAVIVMIARHPVYYRVVKWIVVGFMIATVISILLAFFRGRKKLQIYTVFLDYASAMIMHTPGAFLYIPMFLLWYLIFAAMLILEFGALWSGGELVPP